MPTCSFVSRLFRPLPLSLSVGAGIVVAGIVYIYFERRKRRVVAVPWGRVDISHIPSVPSSQPVEGMGESERSLADRREHGTTVGADMVAMTNTSLDAIDLNGSITFPAK